MMIACSSIRAYIRSMLQLSGHFQQQMRGSMGGVMLRSPSGSCCLMHNIGHSATRYSSISVSDTSAPSSLCCFRTFNRVYYRYVCSKKSKNKSSLMIGTSSNLKGSQGTCFAYSSGYRDPVRAEVSEDKGVQDESSGHVSHGKKVYTDFSVIGIPGDGRCLFRSVAHGACLRSGKPAPSDSLQRELADELRARVAEEFVKRREETEWFIEGDFDSYISQIQKPHVWGGEPELLMLSHVLRMPITVYMRDGHLEGLIAIAEYGQEYGKDSPIRVLYHGFGHYDALLIPGKKGSMSRL